MHFWLVRPLARKLAAGQVSEREGMHYFLASTLIILTQTQLALWWGPRSGWLFYFEFLALAVIACIGCVQCWKVSGGKQFVFRALCLSVPAGIQVFVMSLAFGLVLHFNAEALFDPYTFRDPARAYDLVSYVGFFAFSIYFWYALFKGLAVADAEAAHVPAT